MKLINLDRPIAFQRCFVELTGSICGGLLLSQAVYWHLRANSDDGWWWKTTAEWTKETGMSRREIDTARKSCAKYLNSERRGAPAKMWYCIDEPALETGILDVQTRLAESAKLERRKAPDSDGGKRQTPIIGETTSETTPIPAEDGEVSQHAVFVDLWTEHFPEAHGGRDYVFGGGKDAVAVKRLLTATKKNAKELMVFAEIAWKNEHLFNCKQAVTIAGLASRWNDIMAELEKLNLLPKTKTPPVEGGVEKF